MRVDFDKGGKPEEVEKNTCINDTRWHSAYASGRPHDTYNTGYYLLGNRPVKSDKPNKTSEKNRYPEQAAQLTKCKWRSIGQMLEEKIGGPKPS